VRLVVRAIEEPGGVVVRAANSYTYTPYGSRYDVNPQDGVENPWKFTGQWHDGEIDQYYLSARQYDPTMMRFTGRDPENIYFQEPLTINKYVYCFNNPALYVDWSGEFGVADGIIAGYEMHMTAVGVAATGVEMGNWDVILFGAFLDTMITPAILKAMVSARNNKASADDALSLGDKWVGSGYKEIAPGVFRSADGTKIFRITEKCISGTCPGMKAPHVVFEWIEEGVKNPKKIHLEIFD
jgi:RHS repeat-associated protein